MQSKYLRARVNAVIFCRQRMLKNVEKIAGDPRQEKAEELITTKPVLQEMLKGKKISPFFFKEFKEFTVKTFLL